MKKTLLAAFFVMAFFCCRAQVGNTGWDGITKLGTLQSGNASFSIEAYKEKSCEQGGDQWAEIIIKNMSGTRYLLEFDVVVTTICGNQASKHFSLYLDGNDQQFGARAVMYVGAKTCAGAKVSNASMLTAAEVDRIKSVGYRNFTYNVRELAGGNTTPANTDQTKTTRANSTGTNAASTKVTAPRAYNEPANTAPVYTPPATNNTVGDLINTAGNALLQLQEQKAEQRRQQEQLRQQQQQEKFDRETQEREAKRQREQQQEEERQQERESGRADRLVDFNTDMNIGATYFGNYPYRKPGLVETEHPGVKTVYYVAYCHLDNVVTVMPPLNINKYSDDSWILNENLMAKIKQLFIVNTIKDYDGGITDDRLVILGYFTSAATATAAFNTIKQNSASAGYTVRLTAAQKPAAPAAAAAPGKTAKPKSDDFWNN